MLSIRSIALLALSIASYARAQDGLLIASPVLYSCQPAAYSYTCTNGPCNIFIRPSTNQAETLQSFMNLPTGQGTGALLLAYIYDAAGNFANNAATAVFEGSNSCLNGTAGTTTGGGASATTATTTSSASGRGSTTPESSSSTTSSASASTMTTSIVASTTTAPATTTVAATTTAPAATLPANSGASSIFVQSSALATVLAVIVVVLA